jgi:hypothetical protein
MLEAKEVDFAASLIMGSSETESVVVLPVRKEEAPAKKVAGGGAEAEAEARVKGGAAEDEGETRVKGGAEADDRTETRVAGGVREAARKKKISGITDSRTDEEIRVAAKREPKLADLARVQGKAGDRARLLLEKIREKKPNATPDEVETLLKAGGVVLEEESRVAVARALEEEAEQLIAQRAAEVAEEVSLGAEQAADASESTFGGVTQRIGDQSESTFDGVTDRIGDGKSRIGGVTDVRTDEKIVIKGDKPQDLVDRSVTRIQGGAEQKERELKMKALEGSTDLMKAALAGDLAGVGEKLAASAGVELRKTDAEGRTAVHYAAMGGSVAVLKLILEKGGSLNTSDSKRRSPLFFSALYKQNEAFFWLLEQGGKISQQAMGGMTVAMVAASNGNLAVLKTALQRGVRADTKDHSGKTALDLAKLAKQEEIVAFLQSPEAQPAGKAKAA